MLPHLFLCAVHLLSLQCPALLGTGWRPLAHPIPSTGDVCPALLPSHHQLHTFPGRQRGRDAEVDAGAERAAPAPATEPALRTRSLCAEGGLRQRAALHPPCPLGRNHRCCLKFGSGGRNGWVCSAPPGHCLWSRNNGLDLRWTILGVSNLSSLQTGGGGGDGSVQAVGVHAPTHSSIYTSGGCTKVLLTQMLLPA